MYTIGFVWFKSRENIPSVNIYILQYISVFPKISLSLSLFLSLSHTHFHFFLYIYTYIDFFFQKQTRIGDIKTFLRKKSFALWILFTLSYLPRLLKFNILFLNKLFV